MNRHGIESIGRNASSLFGARLISFGLRTVYIVLVARILGPELYGLLIVGQSWYLAFLPLALMGLSAIIGREIGRDRSQAPGILARTFSIRVFATFAAAIACGTLGWFLSTDATIRALTVILSIALAARSLSLWVNDIYAAFEINRYTLRQELLFRVVEVSLSVGVLLSGGGVLALASAHALVWWGQALYSLFFVHRKIIPLPVRLSFSGCLPVLAAALPLVVSGAAHGWQVQGPVVLFKAALSADDLTGQFALAMQILYIAMALPEALSIAALPVLSRSAERKDGKDLMFLSALARSAFLFGAILSLFGLAIGPWMIPLFFGGEFAPAGQLLGLALLCLIPYSIQLVLGAVLLSRGRYYAASICQVLGAAVLTLSLPALAPTWGTLGAVAATGLGFSVSALGLATVAAGAGWFRMQTAIVRPLIAVSLALAFYFLLQSHAVWAALCVALVLLLSGFVILKAVTLGELKRLKSNIASLEVSRLVG